MQPFHPREDPLEIRPPRGPRTKRSLSERTLTLAKKTAQSVLSYSVVPEADAVPERTDCAASDTRRVRVAVLCGRFPHGTSIKATENRRPGGWMFFRDRNRTDTAQQTLVCS
ncbi:TrkA domain-containing protein [Anopheles sinensis]|uniref:TrkA domain-containing protein n=1 Tax=Anopheles sinensis TaxID=74873 RepID=A0A084VSA0_ANOSI|nr:TrkA domain-containing protein [Anopheles sinensis]